LAPPFLIKNVESCENEISQCVEKGVGWRFPNEMGVGWRFPNEMGDFLMKWELAGDFLTGYSPFP
jgi:hypothetical protein